METSPGWTGIANGRFGIFGGIVFPLKTFASSSMQQGESSRNANEYTNIYVTQPIMIPVRFGNTKKNLKPTYTQA